MGEIRICSAMELQGLFDQLSKAYLVSYLILQSYQTNDVSPQFLKRVLDLLDEYVRI